MGRNHKLRGAIGIEASLEDNLLSAADVVNVAPG
jgi:hypothetical protein